MNRKNLAFVLVAVFVVIGVATAKAAQPAPPRITVSVVQPAAKANWEEGSTQTVAWTITPDAATPDSIQIVLGGIVVHGRTAPVERVLTTFVRENPSKWEWAKATPMGTKLKIIVKAYYQKKTVRASQTFNIVAGESKITPPPQDKPITWPITVKSPNGGEIWHMGASHQITWSIQMESLGAATGKTVDIYLSRDGGQTYPELIAKDLSLATTDYTYKVTGASSDKCIVKVMFSGQKDGPNAIMDVSDKPFRIVTEVEQQQGGDQQR